MKTILLSLSFAAMTALGLGTIGHSSPNQSELTNEETTEVNTTYTWWKCTGNNVIVRTGAGKGYSQARDPYQGHRIFLNKGEVVLSYGSPVNGYRRAIFADDDNVYWVSAQYLRQTSTPRDANRYD